MFVAYLIPKENFALLKDGLQFIAKGRNAHEAGQNLRFQFEVQMIRDSHDVEESERIWNQHALYITNPKGI
jgi:hypothetical protein